MLLEKYKTLKKEKEELEARKLELDQEISGLFSQVRANAIEAYEYLQEKGPQGLGKFLVRLPEGCSLRGSLDLKLERLQFEEEIWLKEDQGYFLLKFHVLADKYGWWRQGEYHLALPLDLVDRALTREEVARIIDACLGEGQRRRSHAF